MSFNKTSFEVGSSRPRQAEVEDANLESGVSAISSHPIATLKLTPTPSNDPYDPLNWPMWLKVIVLIQTSLLAAIGGLNTATINPALGQVAEEFGITTVRASYQTTVCIALNGIAPWIWIPFAYKYGRRPTYLITTLIAFGSILGCAYAQTYSQLLVARVFNGIFPVGFAIGATTVTDLFFYHQRGRALGLFTVSVASGSHLAPIIGGLLGQYCGWRWIFKFLAIVDGVMFIVALFWLPETNYTRILEDDGHSEVLDRRMSASTSTSVTLTKGITVQDSSRAPFTFGTYVGCLRFVSPNPAYRMRPTDFVLPTLRMALYPSAIFPTIYYSAMYGFASIVPAVTAAPIFTEFFHWNTLIIGLTYGTSLTIGGILGELCSGWVCDLIVQRAAAKLSPHQTISPELRLRPVWAGEFITVAGLLMYGFTLHYRTHWFLPIFSMGMACFGLQIITTTMYTYAIDIHRGRSAEVAQLINFVRQMFGMTYAFYVVKMGEKIGYQWTFLIFAVCGGILAFLPIVGLMVYGSRWRRWAEAKWGKAN